MWRPTMRRRRVFGDETWRLALAGDRVGLWRAASLLHAEQMEYDAHRARAFARALDGDVDAALAELNAGWTHDWPFPTAYAADIARVRFLAGDYESSLGALQLAVYGTDRLDPQIADLAAAVVARAPRLRLRAVRVVLAGGSPWQRLRNAALAAAAR
jgi:nucleotide-binding universal stress UspA family protein